MTAAAHRASFFRQSGWLMIATVAGGLFMTAVHFLSKAIPEGGVWTVWGVPFGRDVHPGHAAANGAGRNRPPGRSRSTGNTSCPGLIRAAWLGTFVVWLVAAGVVLLFQGSIMAQWKISNPAAIWLTLPVLLFTVWLPMFSGVLQGQQNFLWLGWSRMRQGVGRLAIAAFAVLVLHYYAPGMVLGILGGLTRRPRDRHLADAVPLACVPAVFRMAQPAPPDHPADAGLRGVPVYADG